MKLIKYGKNMDKILMVSKDRLENGKRLNNPTRTQKGVPSHLKNVWVKYKRKTKTVEDKTDKRESGDWLHSAEAASRLMAFGGRVVVGAVGGRA